MVATGSWGLDNTLSRPLAERDPGQVVMIKGAMGALATTAIAVVLGDSVPGWRPTLALLTIGATGYGLSLRFYLLAQRAFGAARTGSIFAFAPFIGALAAVLAGERSGGGWLLGGAFLMLLGIVLHLAKSHAHEHAHDALEHEHAHRHDDDHHDHTHDPMPAGVHSHVHRHRPLRHVHAHVPDEHHAHSY